MKRHLSRQSGYTGGISTPTSIHFIQYGENEFFEKKISDTGEIQSLMAKENLVNWIRVIGMEDSSLVLQLANDFGLNQLDAKKILSPQSMMTVEEYDGSVFVVLPVAYFNDENRKITEHVALILGRSYVVSFQESNYPLFEGICSAIKEDGLKINNKKADFLLANILNEIIFNYADCVNQLEESMEELEEQLLDLNKLQDNLIGSIQESRREMIRYRKQLLPFKDQLAKLLRVDESLISKQEIPFFKDINDQLLFVLQSIESCREIMSSLVDLYLNNNDLKMNIVMKHLTVLATIFIPLTFVVGVWGMNFKFMPELEWRYGYAYAWGLMIICGVGVWWYLKKKDWF